MTANNIVRSTIRYPASAAMVESAFYGIVASALIAQILVSTGAIIAWQALAVLTAEWLGVMAVCGWTPVASRAARARLTTPAETPAAEVRGGRAGTVLLQMARITRIVSIPQRTANADQASRYADRQDRAA